MEKYLLEEIIECLPKGRTKYYYFKDRYALMQLSYLVGGGMTVAELKKSHLQGLLKRPQVKKLLAGSANGFIESDSLCNYWPEQNSDSVKPFILTLGGWGGCSPRWQQTTRHGYNLVVQLNFSNEHDRAYKSLVKPVRGGALNYYGHPVLRPGRRNIFRETLAWARLDIDFDTNEVLIEEIQSDWVREAKDLLDAAEKCHSKGDEVIDWYNVKGKTEDVISYVNNTLSPYEKIWDEAILSATIEFVINQLGIKRIYYHSYESGPELKSIEGRVPRNLYTKLPKKFGFEKIEESPEFLQKNRRFKKIVRKIISPMWYRMDTTGHH
ncbi:hypothetical protein MNBD_GAMMA09-1067 [hydrothermal vent metagenome]|uniref:Uncharacterized protein n=1 Tax=hydrothermal vent metagenome TaxID=652676 RepID=A0A3B0XVV9_9ZZZZ